MTIAAAPTTPAKFRDYLDLTKPRLSLLSVLTALVGYLAARPPSNPAKIFFVLLGTSLAAGGVAALNQWLESDTDAQMQRTADRRRIGEGVDVGGGGCREGSLQGGSGGVNVGAQQENFGNILTAIDFVNVNACAHR